MEFDVKGATGIEEELDREFNIYPNPADEKLFIESNSQSQNLDLAIYNMTGQLVKKGLFRNTGTIELNVSDLTKGIYILKINTDTDSYNTRIIIQ